ncbi:hypothetical protein BCE02nite_24190 [Brevibacillus centrosporus]|nr:hypothetical protein BCE02nite_24190 [Brevibacillus centrosporus]
MKLHVTILSATRRLPAPTARRLPTTVRRLPPLTAGRVSPTPICTAAKKDTEFTRGTWIRRDTYD